MAWGGGGAGPLWVVGLVSHYAARVDLLVIGGSGLLGRRVTGLARLAGHRVTATFCASVPAATDVDWRELDIRRRDDVVALARRSGPTRSSTPPTGSPTGRPPPTAPCTSPWPPPRQGPGWCTYPATPSSPAPRRATTRRPSPIPITPYGAAKAAAETAIKGITPGAVIARTSLIIGDGDSQHERLVHALASGTDGTLFTDEVRCPVDVTDLASALLELAAAPHAGVCHVAGADAISRYQLGLLIAGRDGLDQATLPRPRTGSGLPGAIDVRLDSTKTQARLTTRLRGAREFLAPT